MRAWVVVKERGVLIDNLFEEAEQHCDVTVGTSGLLRANKDAS